ncbi:hypothetical protein LTS10_013272 [Elasticomyces elasticus]|nr:hypothetical protein LTS10_013272 [Elasticomyces elasticus]
MEAKFLDTTAALKNFLDDLSNCDGQHALQAKVEARKLDIRYQDRMLGSDTVTRCQNIAAKCNHFAAQSSRAGPGASAKVVLIGGCMDDYPGLKQLAQTDQDFYALLLTGLQPVYTSLQEASDAAEESLAEREKTRTMCAVFTVFILVGIRDPHVSPAVMHRVGIKRRVAKHGFCIVGLGADDPLNVHGLQANCTVDRVSNVTKVLPCEVHGITIALAKVATTKTFTPGRRVAPVDKREDADAQLRVDAGEKIGDKQNFVLQVNSQAKNTALKKFVAQNGRGTHAQLAAASFDTKAADPEAEARRVVQEMKEQSKSKLG